MLKQINLEVENFRTKDIQIVPGFDFNQYETINTIYFYYNSRFTTGDTDFDGDHKYFYNIVKNPCKVFTKAVDFDTKNIRLLTTGGGDPLKTWFMERDLKFWMRDKQFGLVLNRLFTELPIFGTVVLKIIDGEPYFVDLRNFVVDQCADHLDSASHIIEQHMYTIHEFQEVAKEMKWGEDKVKEAIKNFREMKGAEHIRVYERYGEVEDEDGEFTYRRVFYADVGVDEIDRYGEIINPKKGVELASDEWNPEDLPYWEFHVEKIPGRWLGVGVVETLFEPQIRQNELANVQAKTTYWAGLRIFQTRDNAVNRNLYTDTRNGEILNVDSEITQVDMSDRNLAFFNEEYRKWLNNRDELSFSYDAVQGERSPAGTPLGSTQISIAQTLSHFETIQESIALRVKEMLYEVIIPQFEKENTKEHTIRLVGQDLDQYIAMVKNQLVAQEVFRMAINGKLPTNKEKDMIEVAVQESIKQEKEKILDVPKGFYDGIKYDVDIDITGESVDTRVRYATRFAILQAITADPTMTKDPIKKKILFGMAEDGGLNPNEMFSVEEKEPELPVENIRAGGGVSAPQLGAQLPGQLQQTV